MMPEPLLSPNDPGKWQRTDDPAYSIPQADRREANRQVIHRYAIPHHSRNRRQPEIEMLGLRRAAARPCFAGTPGLRRRASSLHGSPAPLRDTRRSRTVGSGLAATPPFAHFEAHVSARIRDAAPPHRPRARIVRASDGNLHRVLVRKTLNISSMPIFATKTSRNRICAKS